MHYPEESVADSILYNSQKIVWIVPSSKGGDLGKIGAMRFVFLDCQVGYQIKKCSHFKNLEKSRKCIGVLDKIIF